jgi:sugar phosphate isomerase/epimerase
LSSSTFPREKPQRIVELAQASGVQGLEWHADYDCPVGNIERAHELRDRTEQAGLACLAYALDSCGEQPETEEKAVITAFEIGASMLRVIPGPNADRARTSLERCYRRAADLGLTVGVAFSSGSSVHSGVAAQQLIDIAGGEHADILWSREPFSSNKEALADMSAVARDIVGMYISGLHPDGTTSAIGERTDEWATYLAALSEVDDDHWIIVRGVEDSDASSLFRDMQTLRRLAEKYGNQ